MSGKYRRCKICSKELKIREESIGSRKNGAKYITTSMEGVFIDMGKDGAWFCNDCWRKIWKEIKNA